jgi:hypothetical protein
MDNDFESGLDDILNFDDDGGLMARFTVKAVTAAIWLLSAGATFGFYAIYAPGLGDWLSPTMAWAISGIQGAFLLDSMTFIWAYLSRLPGSSVKQINTAKYASYVTLACALLVSLLFVILSISLDIGLRNVDGTITRFGMAMQWLGTAVISLSFAVNFVAVFLYGLYSFVAMENMQNARLNGVRREGKHYIDGQRTKLVIGNTLQGVMKQLPDKARHAGRENTQVYINRSFGDLNGDGKIDEQDELFYRQRQQQARQPLTPANEPHRPNGVTRRVEVAFPLDNDVQLYQNVQPERPQVQATERPAGNGVNYDGNLIGGVTAGEDGVDPFLPIRP